MGKFATAGPLLTPTLLRDLRNCLAYSKSTLSPDEAIEIAVRAWMAFTEDEFRASGVGPESAATSHGRGDDVRVSCASRESAPISAYIRAQPRPAGYQWKSLFLPHGTELRTSKEEADFYAHVSGDRIVYKDKPMSPRQFALAAAGNVRNAWRDVWIRRPGDDRWRVAAQLRRECGAGKPRKDNVSPMIAMREVAAAMEATLKTAQGLIAEVKGFAEPRFDRRHIPARRNQDIVENIYQLD